MKKFINLILVAILAIILSSFTNSPDIVKKVSNGNDTVTVKVDVKTPRYQKSDEDVLKKVPELLQQIISLEQSKQILLFEAMSEEIVQENKVDRVCNDVGISRDELFKRARADTIIRFLTSSIIIVILLLGLFAIFNITSNNRVGWQTSVILIIGYALAVFLFQNHLYNFLSFIFNGNYLQIKEILTLIK